MTNDRKSERGVASILTVVFFLLIASVVTIGFARLSLLEAEQALQDSLSKSALAAAYSGVNDGKRALLFCLQADLAVHPECDETNATGINNQSCPGFFDNVNLRNNVGIPDPDPANGSIRVGDDPNLSVNERYTCVIITNDTYDVSQPLIIDQPGENTTVIPIKSAASFNAMRISWQRRQLTPPNLTGLTYNGAGNEQRASYRDTDAYGATFKWNGEWPALMRASLYAHPKSNITYNPDGTTNITDKTAFLFPINAPLAGPQSVSVGALLPRQLTNCNSNGFTINPSVSSDRYICQLTITGLNATSPAFDSANNELYLQLTNMYADTDVTVELLNTNTPVRFDNVSPQIDSTGAVENTFRRVQVRVRYHGSAPILPNAIDTGTGVCKNFIVGGDPSIFRETCW